MDLWAAIKWAQDMCEPSNSNRVGDSEREALRTLIACGATVSGQALSEVAGGRVAEKDAIIVDLQHKCRTLEHDSKGWQAKYQNAKLLRERDTAEHDELMGGMAAKLKAERRLSDARLDLLRIWAAGEAV